MYHDGDIVAIDTRFWLTRCVQYMFNNGIYDNYTHLGMLIEKDNILYIAEMDGKYNVLRPFTQYNGYNKIVFRLNGLNEDKIKSSITKIMASKIEYDYKSFLVIGVRLITKLLMSDNTKKLICTDFISLILKDRGINILDGLLTPAEACDIINNNSKIIFKGKEI